MTFQCALITGASSGIGTALARRFAPEVPHLILSGRRASALNDMASELASQCQVQVLPADLSIPSGRGILQEVIREHCPDLLVNNAGYGLYGDCLDQAPEALVSMLQVNSQAVLELSLTAAQTLTEKERRGVICNVSSAAAFMVLPGNTVYAATKAFVNAFSEGLDFELRDRGVRVLASCPGQVSTPFSARAAGRTDDRPTERSYSMTPEFAAEEIWQQILCQRPVRLFDWRYRLGVALYKYVIPKKWVSKNFYANLTART